MIEATDSSTTNLAYLFTGKFVSELGNGVYYIALSWFVLSKNTGINDFAVLLTVNALPSLLLAPFAGILVDSTDKKRLLQLCDAAQSLLFAALTLLFALRHAPLAVFVAVSLLNGVIRTVYEPTVKATFPFLVDGTRLQKVNAIEAAIRSSTNLIGFFVGGVIVAVFGVIGCFLFNFLSFVVATACDTMITMTHRPVASQPSSLASIVAGLRVGFRSAFATRDLALLFVFTTILTLTLMPSGYLLFPIVLKNVFHFNESLFGLIQAGFPAGIVIGSAVVMLRPGAAVVSPIPTFIRGAAGMSLAVLLWAVIVGIDSSSTALNATVLALSVVAMGVINVVLAVKMTTFLQRVVARGVLGKVLSIHDLAVSAAVPLGLVAFSAAIAALRVSHNPQTIAYIFVALALAIPLLFAAAVGVVGTTSSVARESLPDILADGEQPREV